MSVVKKFGFVAVLAIVCLIPSAFADTAQMMLTSAGNNVMNGVYVGPYTATINGVGGNQVICDDFVDESFLNSPWTATVNTFATLSNTLFGNRPNALTLYEEAAWLAMQMLQQPVNSAQQGYYSFAVWAIFNPAAVQAQVGSTVWNNNILPLIQMAQGQKFFAGEFANVLIYTPTCSSGAGSCQSQEFFQFLVPEGGSAALYLLVAGLVCGGAIRFRTQRSTAERGLA